MLNVSLLSAAAAATTEIPGLGPFPILQLFGGIISLIVLGAAAAIYRFAGTGTAAAKLPAAQTFPPGGAADGVHLYFDGPLRSIDDRLAAQNAMLAALTKLHYETREQIASALQMTRHDVRAALQEDAAEATAEIDELKALISDVLKASSDLRQAFALLDQFMRLKVK